MTSLMTSDELESEELVGPELELICPRPACMCSPRRSFPLQVRSSS